MRSIWKGSISFGLVSIAVKVYSATEEKDIAFHQVHRDDGGRIKYKRICSIDGEEVAYNDIAKGYELPDGDVVVLTDDDLAELPLTSSREIDVLQFVPLEQVDPIYFENSYHLGCSPESARAYKLLADAMMQSQRVALAHFTMRNKEHLVIIRPYEGGLMLHTMYYQDEIVAEADVDRGQNAKTSDRELELAKRLIDDLTEKKFDPSKYHDDFRERVLEAAQRKVQGEEAISAAPSEQPRGKVIDLMSALKASLEKRGAAGKTEEAQPAAQEEEPKQAAAASSRTGGRSTGTTRGHGSTKTRKHK
jgi:DNA end-binding protein Ku